MGKKKIIDYKVGDIIRVKGFDGFYEIYTVLNEEYYSVKKTANGICLLVAKKDLYGKISEVRL